MQFNARIYDPGRQAALSRTVDAASRERAILSLQAEGNVVLSIERPLGFSAFAVIGGKLRRRRKFDVRLFCEEVKTLLSAGMSLVEIVDTLSVKEPDSPDALVLLDLRSLLSEGKAFSTSMEAYPAIFPMVLVAAVRASERTGRVQEALEEYLRYELVLHELRRKLLNAAIYPGLVIAFGIAVGGFLLGYVVPRFAKVYDDFAQNLSVPTHLLIELGRFLAAHVAGLIVVVLAGIAVVTWLFVEGMIGRLVLGVAGRIAPLQRIFRVFQLSRIYQTMAMLIRGGYPVVEAAGIAQTLAFQPNLRAAIDTARRSIAEGRSLSASFAGAKLTDTVTERLLKVGERTGEVQSVLDVIARRHATELETFIERVARVIEPALMMSVGLLIGVMIVLMYMPIFDLANGMQ